MAKNGRATQQNGLVVESERGRSRLIVHIPRWALVLVLVALLLLGAFLLLVALAPALLKALAERISGVS